MLSVDMKKLLYFNSRFDRSHTTPCETPITQQGPTEHSRLALQPLSYRREFSAMCLFYKAYKLKSTCLISLKMDRPRHLMHNTLASQGTDEQLCVPFYKGLSSVVMFKRPLLIKT